MQGARGRARWRQAIKFRDMDWGRLLRDTKSPSYLRVRTIVGELQRDYARWCDKVLEFELASVNSTAGDPNELAETLQREVQALAVDIESYVDEINYLGVRLDVRELFQEGA
jgi:hypothetical protein